MNLTGLLTQLTRADEVREVVSAAPQRGILDVVAPVGLRPPLVAQIAREAVQAEEENASGMFVVATATGREAQDFADALACYMPAHEVAVLPAWETLPHERLSPRSDTVARRLAVFRRLTHPETDPEAVQSGRGPIKVLLVPVRSLLQPVVTGLGDLVPVTVNTG
ncbi:MAG TPA: transcription-repair coupling factor, partial [Actinomycetales bacterium]|nr:transcription-repair coupling factor [Actinomycetales bacterium]